MAAVDVNRSLFVTGKLAYGCTDLSAEWPHGGTGLGLTSTVFWAPPVGAVRLTAEEDGASRAVLYTGGDAVLGAVVESWEDSVAGGVLSALFPNTSPTGGNPDRLLIRWPGADVPVGGLLPSLGPLVFTPRNHREHPALVVYDAICLIEASAQLRLSAYRSLWVPCLFLGRPDAAGRVALMGRLEDLVGELAPPPPPPPDPEPEPEPDP
ncbi:MAG: hypothetical protein M9894_16155 [Planctomycetes bacterium]|nr:hypothetical protein [Planctomycetota bacterium]